MGQSVLAESLAGYASDYPDVEVQRVVTMDRPVDVLIEWSAEARLIVLGARGRGGARGLLLGSTAVKVLRSAACPVLIARG